MSFQMRVKIMMIKKQISMMKMMNKVRYKVMTSTENRNNQMKMKAPDHLPSHLRRKVKTKCMMRFQLIRTTGKPKCFLKLRR